MNEREMKAEYDSWPEEKQLNFFKYLKNLKEDYSIIAEENEMLKEIGGIQ